MNDPDPPGERSAPLPPAFYASPRILTRPALRDWWTLLHPPYTLWHLSYVVIGSCLVAPLDRARLLVTLLAFFLAVGVGAHALDELHGRPLRTTIPRHALVTAGVTGVGGAAALGVLGVARIGPFLIVFIVLGVVLAVGYNLEVLGGRLHNDTTFAAGWGAFPVLTGYYAQHARLTLASAAASAFAFLLSRAQRRLSTPARALRRKTSVVRGCILFTDGTASPIEQATLLGPLEGALRALTWATVTLAATLVLVRLHP